jgi:predicted ATPase
MSGPGRPMDDYRGAPGAVTPVSPLTPSQEHPAGETAAARPLPDLPGTFVGRDELVRNLELALLQRRVVSVVGPGGMGKTTLAVAAARRLAPALPDGVCFLDLARLSSGERIGAELATALGIEGTQGNDFEPLKRFLAGKRMLIVLDSCETVIDAAAQLIEEIGAAAPSMLLLATSREPLQAMGEWVHRLPPLTSPPEESGLPAWLVMTYPAVRLFCRIAEDRHAKVAMTRENLDLVAALCRRLDGNPLSIALAAAHSPRLGLKGVAEQVGRRMLTLPSMSLGSGRHQTLEAVLDWSHQLLQEGEKQAFRSLACFRGSFDLDAAVAVVAGASRHAATAIILDLVAKSLLMPQQVGQAVQYRMPDMTRAFAEGQLQKADCNEYRAVRRRHALFLIGHLESAGRDWNDIGRTEWRRRYGVWVEDVRHALGWAFSEEGDQAVAIELTASSFALAEQTALFADYVSFAIRSLQQLSTLQPERPDLAARLHLIPCIRQHQWLSDNAMQSATLAQAIVIGRAVGTPEAQLGALLANFSRHFQVGDYADALPMSEAMQSLARVHADAVVDLTARRTRAQALHFLGDHAGARELASTICRQPNIPIPLSYTPSPVVAGVSMRILLARIQWIEGHADQAWRTVEECVDMASHEVAQSFCQALAVAAVPVAIWCGRLQACDEWVGQLVEHAGRFNYPYWQTWGGVFQALLRHIGRPLPVEVLDAIRQVQQTKFRDHIGTFDARHLADDALARVDAGHVGWCAPEVLRIHAEREMDRGAHEAAAAFLGRSLALARSHGALAWELRAAMTGIRLSDLTGDRAHGRALLASVYDRFTEGFGTRDLQDARQLLGRTR